MTKKYKITNKIISLADFNEIISDLDYIIEIGDDVKGNIINSRNMLDKFVEDGRIIYGVNTSMGGFVNYVVPTNFAKELQNNLLASVASNVGNYFNDSIVRAIMLARIISLSKGASAISYHQNHNKGEKSETVH